MGVFNVIKKKKKETCCSCKCEGSITPTENVCCGENTDGICCIKVLGSGCKSCHEQFENVKEAVKNLGLNIEVEYITDMEKVMSYGVTSMPAIVVNDSVAVMGKVLKAKDVEKLLSKF